MIRLKYLNIILILFFLFFVTISVYHYITGKHISVERYNSTSVLLQIDILSKDQSLAQSLGNLLDPSLTRSLLDNIFNDSNFSFGLINNFFSTTADNYGIYGISIPIILNNNDKDEFINNFEIRKEELTNKIKSIFKLRFETFVTINRDKEQNYYSNQEYEKIIKGSNLPGNCDRLLIIPRSMTFKLNEITNNDNINNLAIDHEIQCIEKESNIKYTVNSNITPYYAMSINSAQYKYFYILFILISLILGFSLFIINYKNIKNYNNS